MSEKSTVAPEKKPLVSGAMSADIADANQRTISAPLGHALVELADKDDRIVGLSADLAKYTDLHIFRDAMPDRFYQVGMAEMALVGAATGLAQEGFVPFASTYSVFATRRAYDFIALDIAEANLNVNMVCALPGLTTGYGPSHQATEDIAMLRAMPNMTIVEAPRREDAAARTRQGQARPDLREPHRRRRPVRRRRRAHREGGRRAPGHPHRAARRLPRRRRAADAQRSLRRQRGQDGRKGPLTAVIQP